MKNLTLFFFLFVVIQNGYSQSDNYQISTVCKDIENQKKAKFNYVIRDKGSDLLNVLRKEDFTSCSGMHAIIFANLVTKDSTLKNLPPIPEGQYAEWNNKQNIWELRKGGIKEITEDLKNNRTLGNCILAHSGKFKYENYPDPTAYIIRSDNKHIEHYNNDKYSSVFQIRWISDCEYELTFLETNDPQLNFITKGDKLIVQIWNVSSQGYNYESDFKGIIQTGTHIKID